MVQLRFESLSAPTCFIAQLCASPKLGHNCRSLIRGIEVVRTATTPDIASSFFFFRTCEGVPSARGLHLCRYFCRFATCELTPVMCSCFRAVMSAFANRSQPLRVGHDRVAVPSAPVGRTPVLHPRRPRHSQQTAQRGRTFTAAAQDRFRPPSKLEPRVTDPCWSWGSADISPLQRLRDDPLPALEALQLQTSDDALDACRRTVCDLLGQLSTGFHVRLDFSCS